MIIRTGVWCPTCGAFIRGNTICAIDGRPDGFVTLDDFEMSVFECDECGTTVVTPDLECMCEVEEGEIEYDEE